MGVDRDSSRGDELNAICYEFQREIIGRDACRGVRRAGSVSEAISTENGWRERGLDNRAVEQERTNPINLTGGLAESHVDVYKCLKVVTH